MIFQVPGGEECAPLLLLIPIVFVAGVGNIAAVEHGFELLDGVAIFAVEDDFFGGDVGFAVEGLDFVFFDRLLIFLGEVFAVGELLQFFGGEVAGLGNGLGFGFLDLAGEVAHGLGEVFGVVFGDHFGDVTSFGLESGFEGFAEGVVGGVFHGEQVAVEIDAGFGVGEVVFAIVGAELVAELRSEDLGGGEAATAERSLDGAGVLALADECLVLAMLSGPDDAGDFRSDAVEGLGCVAVGEDAFKYSVDEIKVIDFDADACAKAGGGDDPVVAVDVQVGVGDEGALFWFAGGFAVDEETDFFGEEGFEFGGEFGGGDAAVDRDEGFEIGSNVFGEALVGVVDFAGFEECGVEALADVFVQDQDWAVIPAGSPLLNVVDPRVAGVGVGEDDEAGCCDEVGEVFDECASVAFFGAGLAEEEVAEDLHEFVDDEDAAADVFGADAEDAVDAESDAEGVAVAAEESPLDLVEVVFEVEFPTIAGVALEGDAVAEGDDFGFVFEDLGEEVGFACAFA